MWSTKQFKNGPSARCHTHADALRLPASKRLRLHLRTPRGMPVAVRTYALKGNAIGLGIDDH